MSFFSSTCFSPTLVQGLFFIFFIFYFLIAVIRYWIASLYGLLLLLLLLPYRLYGPLFGWVLFLPWTCCCLKLIEPSPMWNEKHTVCVCVCVCLIYLYSLYTHTRDYHIIHKKSRKQQQQLNNNNNQRAIRFLVLLPRPRPGGSYRVARTPL